jgi:hypothetical protein
VCLAQVMCDRFISPYVAVQSYNAPLQFPLYQ